MIWPYALVALLVILGIQVVHLVARRDRERFDNGLALQALQSAGADLYRMHTLTHSFTAPDSRQAQMLMGALASLGLESGPLEFSREGQRWRFTMTGSMLLDRNKLNRLTGRIVRAAHRLQCVYEGWQAQPVTPGTGRTIEDC